MESLREIFIKLGLSVNAAEFAEGLAWEHLLEEGAHLVKEAVEAVGEVFVQAVEKTADFGEQMQLLSIKTGASAEEIQKLGYAAELNGSSAEAMGTAIQRLARQMEQAKDGSAESARHFTKLGISMEQVRNSSPTELMKVIADKLKGMGDAGKASAASMALLGRSAKDLVPTLLLGREGLEETGQDLEDLGDLMSNDSIKAAREFKDSMKQIHAVTEGLHHQLGSILIEALQPVVKGFLEWVKANKQLISSGLQAFAQVLIGAFKKLADVGKFLVDQAVRLVAAVKLAVLAFAAYAVATGIAALATEVMTIGLGQMLVNWALNTAAVILYGIESVAAAASAAAAWLVSVAPVILIAAALVLAALAAEDFYHFLTGGDSVIGHILNNQGAEWSKFIDDFVKPVSGEWWLAAWLRSALAVVMDLEGHLGALAQLLPGISFLQWAASKSEGSPGTGGPSDQEQRIRTTQAVYGGGGSPGGPSDQEQRIRTTQAVYGGGGSPGASAESAQRGANYVHAPSFNMPVTIIQGPGQSAGGVADAVGYKFNEMWDAKMRETAPVAGK
jgi:hypothetical protein